MLEFLKTVFAVAGGVFLGGAFVAFVARVVGRKVREELSDTTFLVDGSRLRDIAKTLEAIDHRQGKMMARLDNIGEAVAFMAHAQQRKAGPSDDE